MYPYAPKHLGRNDCLKVVSLKVVRESRQQTSQVDFQCSRAGVVHLWLLVFTSLEYSQFPFVYSCFCATGTELSIYTGTVWPTSLKY